MAISPSTLLNNQLQSGLSVAAFQNQQQTVSNAPVHSLAQLSPPGPSPTQVLQDAASLPPTALRYLNDNPLYYIQIGVYNYNRIDWATIGNMTFDKYIIMPMPSQLNDAQNIKYSPDALNLAGYAGSFLGGQVGSLLQNGNINKSNINLANAKNALAGGAASGVLDFVASQFGSVGPAVKNSALAAAGFGQNEFLTIMLEGPEYKSRDFHWKLSPNTPAETTNLANIIEVLNNAQAPSISGLGYAFWSWPKVFKIEFRFKDSPLGNVLFQMKPMVLMNSEYKYTPDGVFAPYTGTHGPNAIEIGLKFLELELWVNTYGNQDAYRATSFNPSAFDNLSDPIPGSTPIGQGGIGGA